MQFSAAFSGKKLHIFSPCVPKSAQWTDFGYDNVLEFLGTARGREPAVLNFHTICQTENS